MNRRLKLHILFWCAYILFESYLEYSWINIKYPELSFIEHWKMAFYGEAVICVAKIPLCYYILYLLKDYKGGTRETLRVILLSAVGFAAAIIIYRLIVWYYILPIIYHGLYVQQGLFTFEQNMNAFLDLVFVLVVVVAIKQYRLAQVSRQNADAMSKERLEAELKFLRSQTNPHFLFNTLNNIYALARKKSDLTADAVMRLSKLLRFMLYESGNGLISISRELKVLSDYIELEKIRYNERLLINFQKSVDNEEEEIVPLILLPFVDNAFKHGVSESRFDSYININVQVKAGQLYFTVENSKEEDGKTEVVHNIGLGNVKRQLQLVYPDHQLIIENKSNTFKIILTVNLHSYATI